jgi:hypothetical protein
VPAGDHAHRSPAARPQRPGRQVIYQALFSPERRRRAWLDADPQAPGRVGAVAVEAVALGGPVSLVDDAGRMASELVASAIRHTDAPVELTVDAGDDMVRIEVRDDDGSLPGSGRVVSFELREA